MIPVHPLPRPIPQPSYDERARKEGTTTMRPLRFLLAGCAMALLLMPATALAQTTPHAALRDMTCTGIDAVGTDMPKSATLQLTLVDEDKDTPLAHQTVTTSPAGTFNTTVNAQLNQVARLRLAVAGQDGAEIAFANHEMDKMMPMCDLPFTGTRGGTPLLLGGSGLVLLGILTLILAARRARKHVSAGGQAV
jgi:hypothetical protein